MLGRHVVSVSQEVAEAVRVWLEHGKRFDVGLLLRRIRASGVNDICTSTPAFFAACSMAASPPSPIRSASDTFFLLPALRVVELLLDLLHYGSTFASSGGLLTAQSF